VERKNSLGDEEAHARLHTHEWGLLPPLKWTKKKKKKKKKVYILEILGFLEVDPTKKIRKTLKVGSISLRLLSNVF
jgi:hypothetical protein